MLLRPLIQSVLPAGRTTLKGSSFSSGSLKPISFLAKILMKYSCPSWKCTASLFSMSERHLLWFLTYGQVLYFELLHVGLDPPDLHPHLSPGVPHGDLVAFERRASVRLGRAPLHRERVRPERRDLQRSGWRRWRACNKGINCSAQLEPRQVRKEIRQLRLIRGLVMSTLDEVLTLLLGE